MEKLIVYTDGGSRGNPGIAGAGVVITDAAGQELKVATKALGVMTNNEAEYQGVLLALETLKKLLGKDKLKDQAVDFKLDSELVVRQLRGEYQIKEDKLGLLFLKIWNARIANFPLLTFTHISREQNTHADALANEAMDEQEKGNGYNSKEN